MPCVCAQAQAQLTHVVRVPGFFSAEDIAAVHAANSAIGDAAGSCRRADTRWCVLACGAQNVHTASVLQCLLL